MFCVLLFYYFQRFFFCWRFCQMHLFDIDIPGKIKFTESDTLSSGDSVTTFTSPWGTIGVGICYDIRFPIMWALMAQQGCSILICPGAFNSTTGPLHWELLARARAVDFQSFVIMASVAFDNQASYPAWGHSMVVSPMGRVLVEASRDPCEIVCELDMNEVDNARVGIPVRKQQRSDVYEIINVKQTQSQLNNT
eukprot:c17934_g1_i3.p1 GENE.c17934_g1_i3~~c17934_g1_i3.p1  ORF type:complete len:194 (-),score=27.34 c17934_g1_i3:96-677(-)